MSKLGASKPVSALKQVAKPTVVADKAVPKKTKQKTGKSKAGSKEPAKPLTTSPTKAAVKKAAKAVAKASSKTKLSSKSAKKPRAKPASAERIASAKPVAAGKHASRTKTVSPAPVTQSLGLPLQLTVPAALAVNSKLVDMAHSNVSAGLELARDLAGARTPMEAMSLGVAYWFNHMGAVHAQARELQSLSAAWVKTASERVRST